MASQPKPATTKPKAAPMIDPDVKEFVDALLVPLLVDAALRDIEEENRLADSRPFVGKSRSDNA